MLDISCVFGYKNVIEGKHATRLPTIMMATSTAMLPQKPSLLRLSVVITIDPAFQTCICY